MVPYNQFQSQGHCNRNDFFFKVLADSFVVLLFYVLSGDSHAQFARKLISPVTTPGAWYSTSPKPSGHRRTPLMIITIYSCWYCSFMVANFIISIVVKNGSNIILIFHGRCWLDLQNDKYLAWLVTNGLTFQRSRIPQKRVSQRCK